MQGLLIELPADTDEIALAAAACPLGIAPPTLSGWFSNRASLRGLSVD